MTPQLPPEFDLKPRPRWLQRLAMVSSHAVLIAGLADATFSNGLYHGDMGDDVSFMFHYTTAPTLLVTAALSWFWWPLLALPNSSIKKWLGSASLAALHVGPTIVLSHLVHHVPMNLNYCLELLVRGATAGMLAWVPGLLISLLLFALPMRYLGNTPTQDPNRRERADRWLSGLYFLWTLIGSGFVADTQTRGQAAVLCVALCVMAMHLTHILRSSTRHNQRVRFLQKATKGEVDGFRVEQTEGGSVLLLRMVQTDGGYRVGGVSEPVADLNAYGDAEKFIASTQEEFSDNVTDGKSGI
jgi:hypothetical protein